MNNFPFTPQSARVWAVEQILSCRSRLDNRPINKADSETVCAAADVLAKFVLRAKPSAKASFDISIKGTGVTARAGKVRNSPVATTEPDLDAAIEIEVWRRNSSGRPIDEMTLRGRSCWTAVDLSSKSDIASIVHVFAPMRNGERWIILPRFFVPAEGVIDRETRDRAKYQEWVEQGFMRTTPGNQVDYQAVFKQLMDDHEAFDVVDVAVDPWNAGTLISDGINEGMNIFEFGQNTRNYSFPTEEFLRMLSDDLFDHGDNPVLTWMASNLRLVSDHNGNKMPTKKNIKARIDGIAAIIMAVGRAITEIGAAAMAAPVKEDQ